MSDDAFGKVVEAVLFFIPFLFALSFHEFAHAWVARLKGDRTAETMGRLTLNPVAHADPIGTVALPLLSIVTGFLFFGWAKPVPVDSRNLRHPRNDMFWIAAAGPLSNVLLACLGAAALAVFFVAVPDALRSEAGGGLALRSQSPAAFAAMKMLIAFLQINLVLALFNLIPVHPLDGGKVLARFLSRDANRWLEDRQQALSIALTVVVVLGGLRFMRVPVMYGVEGLVEAAFYVARFFVSA